jgi:hypothetical protein
MTNILYVVLSLSSPHRVNIRTAASPIAYRYLTFKQSGPRLVKRVYDRTGQDRREIFIVNMHLFWMEYGQRDVSTTTDMLNKSKGADGH